ncbi:hypothetical protein N7507_005466 [Penicillium longicatenatum]|nr:hypothetical protein N7507_005466 [Penicillium longicatenatum]
MDFEDVMALSRRGVNYLSPERRLAGGNDSTRLDRKGTSQWGNIHFVLWGLVVCPEFMVNDRHNAARHARERFPAPFPRFTS